MTTDELGTRRAALIIAHPGHELRVHRWLEIARPVVFVLTDGSGHTGQSRLIATARTLTGAGATAAPLFGRFTDAKVYDLIRNGDVAPLLAIVRELAAALSSARVDYVVGDALEGFNPSHDLCRFLINAAVLVAQRDTGREIGNFDVLLDGDPRERPRTGRATTMLIELDEAALRRKLTATERYEELRAEAQLALARFGERAFMTECLRPIEDPHLGLDGMEHEPPQYELYGEARVKHGYYAQVIRYRANVHPLVNELWNQAGLDELRFGAVSSTYESAATGTASVSSHLTDS